MKRIKFGPLIDLVTVDDAATIRALANDKLVDRRFKLHPFLNGAILKRALVNLSYKGNYFPHMLTRDDTARVARQNDLWEKFNDRAALMTSGPEGLKPLAEWIRHGPPDQEPGILVQQVIGEFFTPDFKATAESWQAAVTLREDARSRNLPKMLLWQILGKARQAKQLLGSMVSDDIYAMHGIGVAIHNIVTSVRILKHSIKIKPPGIPLHQKWRSV